MTLRTGLLVFAFLLPMACSKPVQDDATRDMVRRLAAIADTTDRHPEINAHANAARVTRLQERGAPPGRVDAMYYRAQLADELLRAGRNEEAIALFESLLDSVRVHPDLMPASFRLAMHDLLGISYTRLGEQDNCLADPNGDRCLWPVSGDGVYADTRGPSNAITHYEQILSEEPDDLNSLWLVNVAYMTMGAWPDGVPAAWRIPEAATASSFDPGRFPDRAPAIGVDVLGLSGGVVADDLNGDGLLDLVVSSWGLRDQIRLLVNRGDGTFEDRTDVAGLTGITSGLNLIDADYDNDGDVDILVLRGAWLERGYPNSLLQNQGDATFRDVTVAAGLDFENPSHTAAWGDFDGDGFVDLFIGNETTRNGGRRPSELYRNDGDGTFTDVAPAVGLAFTTYAKGVVWGDYDNDGRPDLYVSNLYAPNLLFHNDGPGPDGSWRFSERGAEAGVREPIDSFPTWFFDYDNDGWLDLFVSGWRAAAGDVAAEYLGVPFRAEPPRLYRNLGDGTFADETRAADLWRVLYTMGTNFGDLDNDGWLDFYVGTGDPDFRALIPNRMFRNDGGRRFQDVSVSGGFGHLQKGHGVAFADFDEDGDQDVHIVLGGAFEGDIFRNALFENPGHGHGWLTIRLEGSRSNRSAIGARIRVDVSTEDGPRSIHRLVGSGGSFGATTFRAEIGLGRATRIDSVVVSWPGSGRIHRLAGPLMNAAYRLGEDEAALRSENRTPFRFAQTPVSHAH